MHETKHKVKVPAAVSVSCACILTPLSCFLACERRPTLRPQGDAAGLCRMSVNGLAELAEARIWRELLHSTTGLGVATWAVMLAITLKVQYCFTCLQPVTFRACDKSSLHA